MIQSMTGFGSAQANLPSGAQLCCDIKTVNHKFLDISISLGKGLKTYEPDVLEQVKAAFHRGRIEVSLYTEVPEASSSEISIDIGRAKSYLEQLRALKKELFLDGEIDIGLISGFKDIYSKSDVSDIPPEILQQTIQEALGEATTKVVEMRKTEGKAIFDDFTARIANLRRILAQIKDAASENIPLWREKVKNRIEKFSQDIDIDSNRIEQEVLFHALRSDITEECIRLENHILQFEHFLSAEGALGKKLGFLLHEMAREVNTLTAKALSSSITQEAVALRDEIEHLREQVHNIE